MLTCKDEVFHLIQFARDTLGFPHQLKLLPVWKHHRWIRRQSSCLPNTLSITCKHQLRQSLPALACPENSHPLRAGTTNRVAKRWIRAGKWTCLQNNLAKTGYFSAKTMFLKPKCHRAEQAAAPAEQTGTCKKWVAVYATLTSAATRHPAAEIKIQLKIKYSYP